MIKLSSEILTINSKKAKVVFKKTISKYKIDRASYRTLRLLQELMKGLDSDFYYLNGLTLLNTVSNLDNEKLDNTRISNDIMIIRNELPNGVLITFHYMDNKRNFYGVIKSEDNINHLKKLEKRMIDKLSK